MVQQRQDAHIPAGLECGGFAIPCDDVSGSDDFPSVPPQDAFPGDGIIAGLKVSGFDALLDDDRSLARYGSTTDGAGNVNRDLRDDLLRSRCDILLDPLALTDRDLAIGTAIGNLDSTAPLCQQAFEILAQRHAVARRQVPGLLFPRNRVAENVLAVLPVVPADQPANDLPFLNRDE